MAYDYSKLKGRIVEICGNQRNFARAIGLSERTVTLKLSNKNYFKQDEIERCLKVLGLDEGDIQTYFYTKIVQ